MLYTLLMGYRNKFGMISISKDLRSFKNFVGLTYNEDQKPGDGAIPSLGKGRKGFHRLILDFNFVLVLSEREKSFRIL